MIIGFVGTPGSGKSYEAVCKLLDNLQLGRVVYTNISGLDSDSAREAIKAKTGLSDLQLFEQLQVMSDIQAKTFWDIVPDGCLIMLDECHKLFSNRNWQSEENKLFTEWASTHRHKGFDLVLITQDIEKIDKHARSLIEWTYFFRKINHFGALIKNQYLVYSYQSDDHNGKPLATNRKSYDQSVFACYSSYAAKDVKELGIMRHTNLLKHPVFYAIPVVLLIFIYFLSGSSLVTGDFFGHDKAVAAGMEAIKKTQDQGKKDAEKSKPLDNTPPLKDDQAHSASVAEPKQIDQEPQIIMVYKFSDGSTLYSNHPSPYMPGEKRLVSRTKL